MRGKVCAALAAALLTGVDARAMADGALTAVVSQYIIATPDIGSCRLQGISATSDNFKNYASVSGMDSTLNEGCARCIKATRSDDATKSVTAYVLDVCQGCASGQLKLSAAALTTLAVDTNSNNASVSYKYVSCPSSYMSGNVQACLMEGASNAYIPLQFFNSQKVIASVKIDGVNATSSKDSYLFSATSGQSKQGTSSWFTNITVEMTSTDGETLDGSFSFGASTGCATYTSQFSAASTGGADGSSATPATGSSVNVGAITGASVGGVAALLLIIGSVFFLRRRRVARAGASTPNEMENAGLTPKNKPSPPAPTFASDVSKSGKEDPEEPRSPTIDYEQSFSPAASLATSSIPQSLESPGNVHSVSSEGESQRSYANPPTYSFSSSLSNSPKKPKASTVATFSAPVVPVYSAPRPAAAPAYEHPGSQRYSDEDEGSGDRSSFDIDDMRDTEEMKSAEPGDVRSSAFFNGNRSSSQLYSTSYSSGNYPSSTVTSPQSYVRATSLRRNTATRAPAPIRTTSSISTDVTDGSSSAYTQDAGARQSYANYAPGSFRESSSGYSRESLNILGYPYSKQKSARNGSITEMQF
uniref:Expansin-like EG45 domain-containing protein n=1 Tax=Globisporangium ultimum (strain ATCC 200006 / CBS 805.95 / DAOM BR144) TaxID=431595 RepID=K3X5Z1_GLOUD